VLALFFFFGPFYFWGGARGASRLRDEPASGAASPTVNVNVDDDRSWKLGQFYFNPADPALFVEKRFGIGYTCNFGRPAAWVLIGAFVALIVAALVAVSLVLST
jgi:uncharacterized membrane protein